jgi:hypothetical protein
MMGVSLNDSTTRLQIPNFNELNMDFIGLQMLLGTQKWKLYTIFHELIS